MSDRKRLISDLRVIDLRVELEKRNLDKSGVRGVLIQRLSKHLKEEGLNPEKYLFEVADPKTPSKRSKRSESTVEQEDTPAMEDMIVQDDLADEEEQEQPPEPTNNKKEQEKPTRKREHQDEPTPVQPKKACTDNNKEAEEDQKSVENNLDTEDSINLDLGEDELLNEETENSTKSVKDEGAADDAAPPPAGDDAPATDAAAADDDDDSTSNKQRQNNSEVAAPTSDANGENVDKDQKNDKDKDDNSEKKDKKDESKEGARNLWVSGLSGDTRAKDLKQLFTKYGKVIGAKVVTNARTPGSRCYGYVTMASAQDAEGCIKNLHRTELHGRMISVEKAKSESDMTSRKQPARRSSQDKSKEDADTKEEKDISGDGKIKREDGDPEHATSRSRDKSHRSEKDKPRRSTRSRERRRSPREVLSFSKIWKERDAARARERSRAQREEERRRRAAEEALRERERRQRQEKHRIALEREKLRAERERIEREKNELLRLERERHRLEREKLELERLELKRAQLRLEEERRKRQYDSSSYRSKVPSPPHDAPYDPRHKRAPPQSSRGGGFEAPPPPRFDLPSPAYERDKRDYKRDYPRHMPSSSIKYPTNGNAGDDTRQPLPPGTRPKEPSSRAYESRDSRSYRASPGKGEPRSWPAAPRYPDPVPPAKSKPISASGTGGGGEAWSSSGGGGGGGDVRYGSSSGGGGYDQQRYTAYPPPQPSATYPDRYREYRKY